MALQAGRTGVRKDQVDYLGKVKGGGSGTDLTPRVQKLEGQVGTFQFLVEDGIAGYKKTGADTFTPFSAGGVDLSSLTFISQLFNSSHKIDVTIDKEYLIMVYGVSTSVWNNVKRYLDGAEIIETYKEMTSNYELGFIKVKATKTQMYPSLGDTIYCTYAEL